MGRVTTIPLHWEYDVDAGSQAEHKLSFSPREKNLRKIRLLGWTARGELQDETTAGTSMALHIMKNYTDFRQAMPGAGAPTTTIDEGHWGAYIGSVQIVNTAGTCKAYGCNVQLPKPVEFDRDDTLGLHMIATNKGSAAKRFEFYAVLYVEVED